METISRPSQVSHESLHDDLLLLTGEVGPDGLYDLNNENFDGNVFRLTRNETAPLLDYIHEWLPTKVQQLGGNSADIRQPEGKFMFDMREGWPTVIYTSHQFYGTPPGATQLENSKVVEVGGPTTGDWALETVYGKRPDIVFNKAWSDGQIGYMGPINAVADARRLPLADESVDAIFISCLLGARRHRSPETADLRDAGIKEGNRVIKPGGRLFWHGGTQADYDIAVELGFMPEYLDVTTQVIEYMSSGKYTVPQLDLKGVFIKPEAP